MNDTPPEIARLVRQKLMARSASERFVMGARMFDAARWFWPRFQPDWLRTN